jgi:hypothetical protein
LGGAAQRLGSRAELCAVRLAQEVAALHLAPPGLLDDRHNLSPVLVPAVALGIVLEPAIDELGGPLRGSTPRCDVKPDDGRRAIGIEHEERSAIARFRLALSDLSRLLMGFDPCWR